MLNTLNNWREDTKNKGATNFQFEVSSKASCLVVDPFDPLKYTKIQIPPSQMF